MYAYYEDSAATCYALSGNSSDGVSSTLVSDDDGTDYIAIEYSNGDACASDSTQTYSVIIQTYCDDTGSSSDALNIRSIDTTTNAC